MKRKYTVERDSDGSASPLESPLVQASEDLADPSMEEAVERRESTVAAALHGLRLDKAVVAMAGEFSRNHLQSLIEAGHVWVDGVCQPSPSRKVLAGQRIAVDLMPTQECRAFRPEDMALSVVFEDADVIVIDKPAGLVVHPAPGNWSGTLLNGLLAHHAAAASLPRAGIVHRLDKDTSGLMVVGKTLVAMTALTRQIAAREVRRIYLAVCHGHFEQPTLRIAAPIGRDPRSRVRMAVLPSGGREARTDVERLAVRDDTAEGALSAVRCTLHTGRTHQIRVHMASVGHPLLADLTYGGRLACGLTRQALHATRLGFDHPVSGRPMAFEAPPPADFAAVWQLVRDAR
ncbi:MAG: RluA family pseudouridine synthase [Burkholderiaceae bacterium]|nr:RluA family pseudouridine synthase [Burkholderiaceae bacterium]